MISADPGTEIFDALRAAPCRIDLSPGLPDLAAFPRTAWLRAERKVLDGLSSSSFGYGDPRGAPPFRLAVANWLARNRGIRVTPDEVIVVAGVAQALALLARTLRASGLPSVAVEDPGSLGARQQLQSWQLDTVPVPVDDRGLQVDQLRASGAAAVMLTPAHQFPMGVVLDGARRRDLQQWARDGGLIIEDDYDAEHRYDRPPVPALHAALPGQVCYAGSISKLLAPALRVGWVLAPARYHDALVTAKRDADLGNAVLPQLVLAELMGSGELERHLRFLRRRHVRRRDAMIDAVAAHLPGARVHGAAAGLHLTLTFDALPGGADSLARTSRPGLPWPGPGASLAWASPARARPIRTFPMRAWPPPPWPAASRPSRCPGTGSAPARPVSSSATPRAARRRSTTASPSSAASSAANRPLTGIGHRPGCARPGPAAGPAPRRSPPPGQDRRAAVPRPCWTIRSVSSSDVLPR